jgi:hypothetical protein
MLTQITMTRDGREERDADELEFAQDPGLMCHDPEEPAERDEPGQEKASSQHLLEQSLTLRAVHVEMAVRTGAAILQVACAVTVLSPYLKAEPDSMAPA